LCDNEGTQLVGDRVLTPDFCLREGRRHECDSPILPAVEALESEAA
jgi:dihydroorotase